MVPLGSLWLPILISAVAVFLISFVLHMVLPFHRKDYGKVPAEDAALDAIRKMGVAPGDYMLPCAGGPEAMRSPEFKAKIERGPVVVMTVMPGGMTMGKRLVQWFVYLVVVGVFAAYVAGHALGPGAGSRAVIRFVGMVAFLGYGLGLLQDSIWYSRSWGTTLRLNVDAVIYALATALVFAWMWPR